MTDSIPAMEEFAQHYGIALDDPDLKRAYDKFWESEMNYRSEMNYARHKGAEQGRAEGRANAIDDVATKLRELGVSEEVIEQAVSAVKD